MKIVASLLAAFALAIASVQPAADDKLPKPAPEIQQATQKQPVAGKAKLPQLRQLLPVTTAEDPQATAAVQETSRPPVSKSLKPESVQTAEAKTATDDKKKKSPDMWMKAKQVNAQAIFAGLTEGDFEKVERHATILYGTGILEGWLADRKFDQAHVYEGHVNTFEYSLREIARHARNNDVEATFDSYAMMGRTCVRCHGMLRPE